MSTLNERDRPSPAPTGEALPETAEVRDTRRKLAALLALGAVRAARKHSSNTHIERQQPSVIAPVAGARRSR